MFHIGQHVVCVDDKPCGGKVYDLAGIRRGSVYTVRAVATDYEFSQGVESAVWLVEVERFQYFADPPFAAARFRPVVESKIDIFRALLVTPPVDTPEHVS